MTYTPRNYILKGSKVVPTDVETWGEWFGNADRILSQVRVGDFYVSTVFIGIPGGLFETMVLNYNEDSEKQDHADLFQERYQTWKEAFDGHCKIVYYIHKNRRVPTYDEPF